MDDRACSRAWRGLGSFSGFDAVLRRAAGSQAIDEGAIPAGDPPTTEPGGQQASQDVASGYPAEAMPRQDGS